MKRLVLFVLLSFLVLSLPLAAGAGRTVSAKAAVEEHAIVVAIDVPDGMYSYLASRYSIPVTLTAPAGYERKIGMPILPQGQQKDDDLIIKGRFEVLVPIMPGVKRADIEGLELKIRLQLCDAVKNVCLPPQDLSVKVDLGTFVAHAANEDGRTKGSVPAKAEADGKATATDGAGDTLARLVAENLENPLIAFLLAMLGGFLASLTPCVYPVIPVTLAFFAKRESGRVRGALAYVAGMGLVYTALGLVAGLTGGAFGAIVSSPFFFVAVALVFLALALSLFDVWELRVPQGLGGRLAGKGGGSGSALGMGIVTGLVASPCVGPIVFFILTGVLQKGDPLYGAFLMLGFSIGIGILFLVLALAGGRLARLPKSGNWMVRIKIVFGVLVLVSALHFARQALLQFGVDGVPLFVILLGAALVATLAGIARLGRLYGKEARHGLVLGLLVIVGVGGFLALQPWAKLEWQDNLELALTEARREGKPVFVDVGAVWCSVCRELEQELARNGKLRGFIASRAVPVRLDYDRMAAKTVREYNIVSLPWVMVLDADGKVIWKKSGFERLPELFAEISNVLNAQGAARAVP